MAVELRGHLSVVLTAGGGLTVCSTTMRVEALTPRRWPAGTKPMLPGRSGSS